MDKKLRKDVYSFMKKLLAVILIASICSCMVGCGATNEEQDKSVAINNDVGSVQKALYNVGELADLRMYKDGILYYTTSSGIFSLSENGENKQLLSFVPEDIYFVENGFYYVKETEVKNNKTVNGGVYFWGYGAESAELITNEIPQWLFRTYYGSNYINIDNKIYDCESKKLVFESSEFDSSDEIHLVKDNIIFINSLQKYDLKTNKSTNMFITDFVENMYCDDEGIFILASGESNFNIYKCSLDSKKPELEFSFSTEKDYDFEILKATQEYFVVGCKDSGYQDSKFYEEVVLINRATNEIKQLCVIDSMDYESGIKVYDVSDTLIYVYIENETLKIDLATGKTEKYEFPLVYNGTYTYEKYGPRPTGNPNNPIVYTYYTVDYIDGEVLCDALPVDGKVFYSTCGDSEAPEDYDATKDCNIYMKQYDEAELFSLKSEEGFGDSNLKIASKSVEEGNFEERYLLEIENIADELNVSLDEYVRYEIIDDGRTINISCGDSIESEEVLSSVLDTAYVYFKAVVGTADGERPDIFETENYSISGASASVTSYEESGVSCIAVINENLYDISGMNYFYLDFKITNN